MSRYAKIIIGIYGIFIIEMVYLLAAIPETERMSMVNKGDPNLIFSIVIYQCSLLLVLYFAL